jgi:hypothetical protein
MTTEKQRPAHEIKLGRIKATIWHNETEGGSPRHNVQIRRLYRDDQKGEWKTSDSFGRDDLLLVAEAARQAAVWIHQRAQDEV